MYISLCSSFQLREEETYHPLSARMLCPILMKPLSDISALALFALLCSLVHCQGKSTITAFFSTCNSLCCDILLQMKTFPIPTSQLLFPCPLHLHLVQHLPALVISLKFLLKILAGKAFSLDTI